MESGEPEMIIEMAMFLTFEFEPLEGESGARRNADAYVSQTALAHIKAR